MNKTKETTDYREWFNNGLNDTDKEFLLYSKNKHKKTLSDIETDLLENFDF